MKINERYIQHMTPLQNYRWAKRYYKSEDFLEKLEIDLKGKLYTINARVKDTYFDQTVTILLNYEKDTIRANCTCRFNTINDFCGHVAGTLLAINVLDPTEFPFVDEGQYAEKIHEIESLEAFDALKRQKEQEVKKSFKGLENIMEQVQESMRHTLVQQEEVRLYTEFHRPINDEYKHYVNEADLVFENHLVVRFKVGSNKLFVIKNVAELLRKIDYSEVFRYGKTLKFKHHMESFDPFSKEVIAFMRSVVGTEPNLKESRDLIISDSNLDRFFDLFKDSDFSMINGGFEEKDAHVKLQVIEIEKGFYKVVLVEDYLYTNKYVYECNFDSITRLVCPQNEVLANMVLLINDGYFNRLNQDGLNRLLGIVSSLTPYVECEMNFEFQAPSFETNTLMYLDLSSENLMIKVECAYEDGTLLNILKDNDAPMSIGTQTLKDHVLSLGTLDDFKVLCPLHNPLTEQFIHEDLEKIRTFCEIYVSESVKKLSLPQNVSISIGVKTKNNLLEVDLNTFDFDIKELKEVITAFRKKKKYYQLKNGEVIVLEQEAIERVHDTLESLNLKPKDLDKGSLKVPLYRAFEFDQMEDTKNIQIERQKSFSKLIEAFHHPDKLAINPHYDSILRSYQREGVVWLMKLRKYGFGGILADDMGLGKTLQVIALLESVKPRNHCIVVCPAVLLYNWQDEVAKFSKDLTCVVVSGTQSQRAETIKGLSEPTLLITTYDYMRTDVALYESIHFDYVIIDEAQYIKNHGTKSAKSVKQIQGTYKIALTGTPIENSLAELWSIFDFIMPGYLFDYNYFQKNFERKIIKDEDEKAQNRLKTMVEPFILRRTKKEVLKDLPDKIEQVLTFKFNQEEQHHYLSKIASINNDLKTQLKMSRINKVEILSMLTQLRQICCDSRLLFEGVTNPSSKLQGTMELIETLLESDKRILIFSGFTSMLELIEKELEKKYISFMTLTGSVSKENRKDMVKRFQNGEASVFLISLKAGGVGLNLTQANAVVHYDPWWNLSAQNQATDRAYRIGQKEDVQVFKLIMKDSIEEKILNMQERKQALSDVFVENSEGSIAKMDMASIMSLLNTTS